MSSRKSRDGDDTRYWDHAPCRCPDWLIHAWHEVVYHSQRRDGSGWMMPEEIAEVVGLSPDMLRRFATRPSDRGETHRCARCAFIIPVTLATGNFALINAFAQQAGRVSPGPRAPSDESPEALRKEALEYCARTILEIVTTSAPTQPLSTASTERLQLLLRRVREVADNLDVTLIPPVIPLRRRHA